MGVYLVTGGAGFIGSNLVAKLLNQGHDVHVLDLHAAPKELTHPKLNWFQGDLLDSTIVGSVLRGVDAVVHLAAQTSVPVSVAHPEMTHEINVRGTEVLIRHCQHHNVRRLLMASSAADHCCVSIKDMVFNTFSTSSCNNNNDGDDAF